MAVMQGVSYEPMVGTDYSKMIRHDLVVIHTIVGFDDGGTAAHWTTRFDGFIRQRRDTKYRSEANLDGNPIALAIENEDHGPAYGSWNTQDGHAVPGFTAAQIEAIARILVFCHTTHGIPLVLVPDTRPGRRGVAYHRQGIDGNYAANGFAYGGRISGGVRLSNKTGKVCPGDRRIRQLIELIIPRARVLAGLNPEEDEVKDLFLAHGDDRSKTPNGKWAWGDFMFLVRIDPTLPGGAVRSYWPDSPTHRKLGSRLGPAEQWAQRDLDAIAITKDGGPPASMTGVK